MANLPQRVALVYDWVNKWGGAEQVLLASHDVFPNAPLFTSVYNEQSAPWAREFPWVVSSFIQSFPAAKNRHELYPWAMPMAFESLDLRGYEAVISVTSAFAKGVITSPSTFHLCYNLTPPRFLWSHAADYLNNLSPFVRTAYNIAFPYLKAWDIVAANRPDSYLAVSQTVRQRLKQFYAKESDVLFPPVIVSDFPKDHMEIGDYFLWVGRFVSYKRLDLVIQVFNELKLPLVVVGTGHEEPRLKRLAMPNIKFTGPLNRESLVNLYASCRAVIFFHEEDFGLVPVEAMAAGRPVIALNRGGAAETVIDGTTGLLVEDEISSLKQVLQGFDPKSFSSAEIKKHACQFSKERFTQEFAKVFINKWQKFQNQK